MSEMTRAELERLVAESPTTDLVTAGRAYTLSKNVAYALAREGRFPVPVLKLGGKYRVRTAHLAADLLRTDESAPAATETDSRPTPTTQENEDYDQPRPFSVLTQ